jgi:MarR family transcriptional regulator, organic hydroperoxide resistance regulator
MTPRSRKTGAPISLENQIFLKVLKTADALEQQAEELVRTAGLTAAQYNVLRILRGAEPAGLPCRGIGDRMISHDPDITRLLDRMEKCGLITRERQTKDRRVVMARITAQGRALLKRLDRPVRELHKQQFRHIPTARLKALGELLEEVGARGSQPEVLETSSKQFMDKEKEKQK